MHSSLATSGIAENRMKALPQVGNIQRKCQLAILIPVLERTTTDSHTKHKWN